MISVTYRQPEAADRVNPRLIAQIEKPSVYAILRSSGLFSVIDADDLEKIAAASRVVRARRGHPIWLNGSNTDFIGVAGTGFVKMVKAAPGGGDVTVELFGPGQTFGLCGTLCGTGCPLSAVAVTDLWYLRIPKRAFMEIYQRNGDLKDLLVRRLTARLQSTFAMMAQMASGRVDQRIAAILFMLSESYGVEDGMASHLQVPLTRQEISEMAGTTVESTIRTMSRWQKDGVVTTDRHFISILDPFRLRGIVGE